MQRILEPELMDTAEDAREYDSMDHAAVNESFVSDLLKHVAVKSPYPIRVLDLGAGTALIPIELCRLTTNLQVVAVDAAEHMLTLAKKNVAAAGLADRIELVRADAKQLPFADKSFNVVISNSILHHIPEPRGVIAEMVRVSAPGGLLFHRDLCRPTLNHAVDELVSKHAAYATAYQQKLLADSLRAAFTLTEMSTLVSELSFEPESVQMNSDRHWTWISRIT